MSCNSPGRASGRCLSRLAQGIFATLTGVVADPSGGVVPNAKITLRDSTSGSTRDTTTNGDGYYTFASVPVGTYDLTVEAPNFRQYKASRHQSRRRRKRNVNVQLQVGAAGETVQVNAENSSLAVTDSGEKSFALETEELENFTQVGSNAAEYIKIVPGFGIPNGTQNKSNYNGQTIGINANGDSGSQSPLNAAYSLQRPAHELPRHHGRRRARLRPGLQLRHAGESQLRLRSGIQGADFELQRRGTERPGRDHVGHEGRAARSSTAADSSPHATTL